MSANAGPARRDGLGWDDFRAARGRFLDHLARDAALRRPPERPPAPEAPVPALDAAWNTGWPEEVAEAYVPDAVRREHGAGRTQRGRAAIAQAVGALMDAHPGAPLDVRAAHVAGTVVVLEWELGEVLSGVSVCRMEGALIREERVYRVPAGETHSRAAARLR